MKLDDEELEGRKGGKLPEDEDEDETDFPEDGEDEGGDETDPTLGLGGGGDDDSEDEEEEDEEDEEDNTPPSSQFASTGGARRPMPTRKSLRKSLEDDPETAPALEISSFLDSFASHMSEAIEGVHKRLGKLEKSLQKSLGAIDPVVLAKSVRAELSDVFEETQAIAKSVGANLEGIAKTPQNPKMQQGYTVLQKGGLSDGEDMSAGEVQDIVTRAAMKDLCDYKLVVQAEENPAAIPTELVKSLKTRLAAA